MRDTVLFYESHSGFFYGAQQSLELLVRHLDRQRFRAVFAGPEPGPLTARLADAGVETFILAARCPAAELRGSDRAAARPGAGAPGPAVSHICPPAEEDHPARASEDRSLQLDPIPVDDRARCHG